MAFTVIWENMRLHNSDPLYLFTFSVTLFNTGDISFAYKSIPVEIATINEGYHPVKIGLSDGYIIENSLFKPINPPFSNEMANRKRKTIYEYNRISLDFLDIKNDTVILLKALPTCQQYVDCASCLNAKLQELQV